MHSRAGLLGILALFALLPPGCGDDDTATDDGGADDVVSADADADGDADADVDTAEAEDGGELDTVTVRVTVRDWPAEAVPAEGVLVAFDAPGGERAEAATGADGRVTFEVSDWSLGTGAVTAFVEGYQMVSRMGLTEDDGEVVVELNRLGDPPGFVTLSGAMTSMDLVFHNLAVAATVPNVFLGANSAIPGPTWEIQVPPETALTIVASERVGTILPSERGFDQEVFNWAEVEQAGVSTDTEVAIDFAADATEPHVATGSFSLPARAESVLRGTLSFGWPYVTSLGSDFTCLVGLPTHTDINAEGTAFEWELEYVQPAAVTDPLTCYEASSDGRFYYASHACEEGWPTEGEHDPGLLDLPMFTTVGTVGSPHPLFEPVEWELYDSGVHVALVIGRSPPQRYYAFGANRAGRASAPWIVLLPDDSVSATVPEPPSSTTTDAVLGTGNVLGHVAIWQEDPTGEFEAKWARSPNLAVGR